MKVSTQAEVEASSFGGWFWVEPGGYVVYRESRWKGLSVAVPPNLISREDLEDWEADLSTLEGAIKAKIAAFKIGEAFGRYIKPWLGPDRPEKAELEGRRCGYGSNESQSCAASTAQSPLGDVKGVSWVKFS